MKDPPGGGGAGLGLAGDMAVQPESAAAEQTLHLQRLAAGSTPAGRMTTAEGAEGGLATNANDGLEDDDDESGDDEPSEARKKRRDKRRRYRRRKRDRDLQEELLVRMQHSHLSDGSAPPVPAATKAAAEGEVQEERRRQPESGNKALPYGHGQGQGVGHNPHREDSCLWHYCPAHYDTSRPLYVRVCGLKAAIHIDQAGTIWLNLSQLMKLVGKTKKQTLSLYGEHAFDSDKRVDVKLLDLKDGPKASAYVSEFRARQLVIPFMGPTKSTNFLAELDRIHREFKVPALDAYDDTATSIQEGGPEHVPLYMRFGGGEGDRGEGAGKNGNALGAEGWMGMGVEGAEDDGALGDLDLGGHSVDAAIAFGIPLSGREEAGSEASGPGPAA